MSQYQNLPISTSTSASTKKIFSAVRDQYQYNRYWSNLTANEKFAKEKLVFHEENSNLEEQFCIFEFEVEI